MTRITLAGSAHPKTPSDSTRLGSEDPERQIDATVVLNPTQEWHELTGRYLQAGAKEPFLSYQQFTERASVDAIALDRVLGYLRGHGLGIGDVSRAARTIRVHGTVAQMGAAFGATLEAHRIDGKRHTVQAGELSLPADVAPLITGVLGLDTRPIARRVSAATAAATAPAAGGTAYPAPQIAQMYGFPSNTGKGRRVALIEFGGGYSSDILDPYFQTILGRATPSITNMEVLGAKNIVYSANYVEVLLDIEIAGAIVPDAELLVVFAPNQLDAWVTAIDAALAWSGGTPDAISISWGAPEESWPASAVQAVEQALQNAAAMGVTVLVSSGDSGVDPVNGQPTVWYPASSANALSCGGTFLQQVSSGTPPEIASEVVWNDTSGATGGGISQLIAAPPWQQSVQLPPSLVSGAGAGRGVPDVAGNASQFSGYKILVAPGSWIHGLGTSAVAPLYAALVAQLAELRGKALGFLNATLYSEPSLFIPITQGNNSADGVTGYSAGAGWNACAGLGRVDGAAWQRQFTT